MAVKTIRRISSWTLLTVVLISLGVFVLFYFGGSGEPYISNGNEISNPLYTGEMIIWLYILFGICMFSMLAFGITQFAIKFIAKPLSSLVTLGVFGSFALLLVITYSLADATPIAAFFNKPELQGYNTEFWLKITDMFIFCIVILLSLAIFAVIWGSILKMIRNR